MDGDGLEGKRTEASDRTEHAGIYVRPTRQAVVREGAVTEPTGIPAPSAGSGGFDADGGDAGESAVSDGLHGIDRESGPELDAEGLNVPCNPRQAPGTVVGRSNQGSERIGPGFWRLKIGFQAIRIPTSEDKAPSFVQNDARQDLSNVVPSIRDRDCGQIQAPTVGDRHGD